MVYIRENLMMMMTMTAAAVTIRGRKNWK